MRGIPLTNEELEKLEKYHLEQLYCYLKSNEERLMTGLRSKDKIHDDWWNQFREGGKATDLDRGAERIFYWVLAGFWTPNSAPIGSNLFFETHDAFVHIEVKTSKIDYPADYRGLVPISERQTSYEIVKRTGSIDRSGHFLMANVMVCTNNSEPIIIDRCEKSVILGKVRLFVVVRAQGSRIESVPLRRLIQLSAYRKRRWSFADGWLVLEGF